MTEHSNDTAPADTSGGTALPHTLCPLCGGPNACAPAASGALGTPCWCRQASFPPDLLARVPASQRNVSCICARCAGFKPSAHPDEQGSDGHQASSS